MPKVLISAGHTSMDPGAIFQDMREADLNRNIAKRVIPYLQKVKDVEVKAVPLDLPLFQRIEWINNTGYTDENNDILVEIHVNDADGSKRGVEAWYEGNGDNNSQKLAALLTHHLAKEFKWDSQGAKSEYDHDLGMLTFLNRTKSAAAIIEVLYMDNPEDIKILKDDKQIENVAKSIAMAILSYFGLDEKGEKLPKDKKPDFDKIIKDQVKSKPKPDSGKGGMFDFPDLGGSLFGSNNSDKDDSDNKPSPSGSLFGNNSNSGSLFGNNNNKPSLSGFGSSAGNAGSTMMMDRDQRKKMIEENYMKILGRKPKQSDLNHFLNRGTSEEELIKKMVASQEHVDLIKAKKELDELKETHEKLEAEGKKLKTSLRDMKAILDSLNKAVMHKNKKIKHLEGLFVDKHGMPSRAFEATQSGDFNRPAPPKPQQMEKTSMEKVIDGFIKRFSK